MASTTTTPLDAAKSLVALARKAIDVFGRPDLDDRLVRAEHNLSDRSVHVVVVGEFKQGKSSLVNALLNADICPVDDDIATAVPTFLRFAPEARAQVTVVPESADGAEPPDPTSTPIEIDQVREFVTESPIPRDHRIDAVEVWIGRRLLEDGLTIVDTPGVGGLGSVHALATRGALALADAVVFVTDASQELTATELEFLQSAASRCDNLAIAVTKTDFYPSWRKIVDLDRGHLERAGLDLPILPLSSPLRAQASRRSDRELNAESGFPALIDFIRNQVSGSAEAAAIRLIADDVAAVIDQLITQFEAERASLADPERAQAVIDELNETKQRTELLRSQASKWNQTLNDGIADLAPDVDHDYRRRSRLLLKECDDAIDNSDPAETWAEFEPYLYKRVSHDVLENYTYLLNRAQELSNLVAEHFSEATGEILNELSVYNPEGLVSRSDTDASLDMSKMGLGQTGFTLLRGGYMGVLMFTMIGSMMGIALGPIAVGVGLIMGRKTLKDEKERQLANRRAQAKNAIRKYGDEVSFNVSKDSRDTLRRVQRELRDHYSSLAEELHKSTSDALKAATDAARISQSEREGRLRDVDAELERLRTIRERAANLRASAEVLA